MKVILKKDDAYFHERPGVKGRYYQLPDVFDGKSVIYGEVTGEHGQRVIGESPRIYYIIEGEGEFIVNSETIKVHAGDVVTIPPHGTYNYFSKLPPLKVVLFMDLIDLSKLPTK